MKKYVSPLTAKLSPDNWQERLNPNMLSLDDVTDLLGDFKEMERFSKIMTGYLKEAVRAKMPRGATEYMGKHFAIAINQRVRKGGLDEDLIREEMGEDWVEEHRKPPTEYEELRLSKVEEGEEVA